MSANTGVAPHCQTALAVAMNDSEGTITSSPGPTPRDVERELQRGGAVRRGDRLGGADALGEGGLERLHARALGDPARRDHRGDAPSASPPVKQGRANGTCITDAFASARRGSCARSARHHVDQPRQALLEADLGLEAEPLARRRGVGEPPRDLVDRALRAVLDRRGRSP